MLNFFFKKRTYTNAFESAGIGPFKFYLFKAYTSAFKSAGIGLFKLYLFKTYTSVFESTGIGTTYASAFKSAGIGYIHIFIKAIPALLKTPEQGLKALVQVRTILSPHSKSGSLKRREQKRRDRNFDPIPALFGAIPTLFKTLG